jgi:hypothetical protein
MFIVGSVSRLTLLGTTFEGSSKVPFWYFLGILFFGGDLAAKFLGVL